MKLTLPKLGLGSLSRFSKLQSSIAGVKTPCIKMFLISLKSYQSVDVENGFAWAIWISLAQVMAKRRDGSQTGSLTPDHKKLRIDPTLVRIGGVQYTVGKLSRRATSLL